MKNTRKGFTLVELLVVIAILAILATVSVVGYTSFINRANDSNAATELHQIQSYINADLMADNKWEFKGTDNVDYVVTKSGTALIATKKDGTAVSLADTIKKCPDLKDLGTFAPDPENELNLIYTASNGKGNATWAGVVPPPHTHAWTVKTAKVEKTCTTDGKEAVEECACGQTRGGDVIPAGHTLTDVAAKPKTCTEAGYTAHKACSVDGCDYTEGYETVEAGHEYAAATCTEPAKCSCGATNGSALGHLDADKDGWCERGDHDDPNTTVIYFRNDWNWSDICLYYWIGDTNNKHPGERMTEVGTESGTKLYRFVIPVEASKLSGIQFNGIDNGTRKEANVTVGIVERNIWYMHWEEGKGDHIDTFASSKSTTLKFN